MRVKEALLTQLEAERGRCLSGGQLAGQLGVSRSAVWKAVNALKGEGYALESVPGKGYRLPLTEARLSAPGIGVHLVHRDFYRISVERMVDSTNLRAKALAARGEAEGAVVFAEAQSQGRGRLGRAFYSPPSDGLYMSILLRPHIPVAQSLCLTTAAAVAVCQAIGDVCGLAPTIKWVNDVLVDGKKVCGILTEAQLDVESGQLAYAVVGIGINVEPPPGGYPPELSGVARALYPRGHVPPGIRAKLAAGVLDRFYAQYRMPPGQHLEAYRSLSCVVGRPIWVLGAQGARPAQALSIEAGFGLQVQYEDGTRQVLTSGEVSTRLREGDTLCMLAPET